LAVACHRAPDTKDTLRKALDQANMHQVDVKVDDNERIVHLKGTVGLDVGALARRGGR
jgi:hypothetical protein